jgi:hypothetical protein
MKLLGEWPAVAKLGLLVTFALLVLWAFLRLAHHAG